MLTIKFANAEFAYLEALETEQFYNGASRRVMVVTCDPNAIGVDELNALLTEDNLANIALCNDSVPVDNEGNVTTVTNYYDGYVLKLKCGIESTLVQVETPESAAVYADRLVFKLGRRTYIEDALHKLGL